jgi:predicted  nucleic acid-binding Zn-ribbon protein
MSQVELLFRLQHTDDEIRAAKDRLSEVIRLQSENQDLLAARKRSKVTANELNQRRAQQTDLNLELNSLEDKANRSEQRLYSGTVKNPKELSDLQHEIESLGRRQSALEEELLEVMIGVEEAEAEEQEASESLQQIEAKWSQTQQELQQEQSDLVQRIKDLTRQREGQLSMITPESLAAYKGALRRVGTTAVVALKNNRCRGCQVTVPANLVKAADEGKLVFCDSCSRILCPV